MHTPLPGLDNTPPETVADLAPATRHDVAERLAVGLALLVILSLAPIYITALRVPAVGLYHDDGVYVVTAKALAEGHGYRIISLPGEPRQTKYPPLFPALLAMAWPVGPAFPANLWVLKLVPFGAALAWLWLTFRLYGALQLPLAFRLLAVVCMATVPWTVYLSVTLLSETTFAALCTAALLIVESGGPGTGESGDPATLSWRRIAAAATLSAGAVLTRTAGIALVAGIAAWLLIGRRDIRRALLFGGIVVAWLLPWAVWVVTAPDSGFYGVSNYASWNIFTSSPTVDRAMQIRVVLSNVLWGLNSTASILGVPASLVTVAVTIAVIVRGLLRPGVRGRATVWFLTFYVLLILGWAWPPERFIVVILPLGLWVALAGLPRTRPAIAVGAALLLCLSTVGVIRSAAMARTGAATGVLSTTPGGDRWTDVLAAADWIQAHTRPEDRLVGNLDPVYYLLTGRQALRGLEPDPFRLFYDRRAGHPFGSVEQSRELLQRAAPAVLIDSPDPPFAERPYLDSRYDELERRGALERLDSVGPFRFYRIRP